MATPPERLCEEDFYAWTRDQTRALRRLTDADWNGPLDLVHLADEVEDLGTAARNAVRSRVERIIEHALKLAYSVAAEPRAGWMNSIDDARGRIEDMLTATIRRDSEACLPRLFERARRKVVRELSRTVSMMRRPPSPSAVRTPSTTCSRKTGIPTTATA